jgi:hypothetical protein
MRIRNTSNDAVKPVLGIYRGFPQAQLVLYASHAIPYIVREYKHKEYAKNITSI